MCDVRWAEGVRVGMDLMSGLAVLGAIDPVAVEGWLLAGGYALLFGILFLCGVGLPMPEDVPLIAAGALIATGHMQWAHAGFAAWCGIIGGDLVLYHLGKRFGPNITRVPFVGRHIHVGRLEWVKAKFERWGLWVVAVGRLFAGVRGVMVVTAGTIRYPRTKFLLADGLAAVVSGGLFMLLGYWLGNNLPALMRHVQQGKGVAMLAALVAVGAAVLWWYAAGRNRRRGRGGVESTDLSTPGSTGPGTPDSASAAD